MEFLPPSSRRSIAPRSSGCKVLSHPLLVVPWLRFWERRTVEKVCMATQQAVCEQPEVELGGEDAETILLHEPHLIDQVCRHWRNASCATLSLDWLQLEHREDAAVLERIQKLSAVLDSRTDGRKLALRLDMFTTASLEAFLRPIAGSVVHLQLGAFGYEEQAKLVEGENGRSYIAMRTPGTFTLPILPALKQVEIEYLGIDDLPEQEEIEKAWPSLERFSAYGGGEWVRSWPAEVLRALPTVQVVYEGEVESACRGYAYFHQEKVPSAESMEVLLKKVEDSAAKVPGWSSFWSSVLAGECRHAHSQAWASLLDARGASS